MLKTVVNFLNLKLGLLNYFDLTRCLCELKAESGDDGITAPKEYVSNGNWDNIDFDAFDGVSYWRLRDEITTSPLENAYKAGKRIETTVPLKLVFSVRRDKLTADDAYSYDRIRQTIVKQFNIDDGALKTSLGAEKILITSPTANGDAKAVWDGETDNTGTFEPKYEVVFGSVDIDVVIISKGECLPTECDDVDSDILHAFDFCSAAVRDRLTQTQVDCLVAAYGGSCDPVTEQINGVTIGTTPSGGTNDQVIENSASTPIGTSANPSIVADSQAQVNGVNTETIAATVTHNQLIQDTAGASVGTEANPSVVSDSVIKINGVDEDSIEAEQTFSMFVKLDGVNSGTYDEPTKTVNVSAPTPDPVTEQINGVTIGTVASGGTNNQVIENTDGTTVGTEANPSIVGDATASVNGVKMATIPAEGTENIEVRQETGATLVGSKQGQYWRVDDATVQNNATPTWSDTIEAEGTLTLGQAKALDSDGTTTLLADYIPSADGFMFTCTAGGGACPSVSLAISDTTPNFGDTITLTATATDFTGAITYHFITRDSLGNWNKITQVSDNTYDFVVPYGGTYDIHVICEDGSSNTASDCVQIIAVTLYNKHGIAHAWVGEDVTLVSGLVDSVNDMVGAIDATAASAATRPRFIKDARSELNGMYRAIGGDYLTTSLSTLQDNVTIAGVYDWTQAEDSFGGSYMVFMGGTHATLDAGSRFNIGYLQSTGKHRFNVRTSAGGVGANVQFTPAYGKNIFVLTYNNSTGKLRVNFNGTASTATFSGTIFNSASNFVLLNGDGTLNYGNGWREPVSEVMISTTDLSDADADQLYADLLLKYPA